MSEQSDKYMEANSAYAEARKNLNDLLEVVSYVSNQTSSDMARFLSLNYNYAIPGLSTSRRGTNEMLTPMTRWPDKESLDNAFTNLASTHALLMPLWKQLPDSEKYSLKGPPEKP